MYYETQLYHHGILGQKWGERNGPPYPLKASSHSATEQKAGWKKSLLKKSSTTDESKKAKKSEKTEKADESKKKTDEKSVNKRVSEMSNEELREAINRVKMEQEYTSYAVKLQSDYSTLNAKKVSKGEKFVTDVLYAAGKDNMTQLAKWAMGSGINELLKAAGVTTENVINTKGGGGNSNNNNKKK